LSIEAAKKEFEAGVDAVLGELKRTIRKTKLDPKQLRQRAADRLMSFADEAKAAAQVRDAGSMGMDVAEQLAAL
jgi:ABC-type transporter MlaC component